MDKIHIVFHKTQKLNVHLSDLLTLCQVSQASTRLFVQAINNYKFAWNFWWLDVTLCHLLT